MSQESSFKSLKDLVRLACIPRPVSSPSVGIGRRRRYFILRGDKTYTLQGQEVKYSDKETKYQVHRNRGLWVTLQAENLRKLSIYRIFAAFKAPKNAAYEQEKVP